MNMHGKYVIMCTYIMILLVSCYFELLAYPIFVECLTYYCHVMLHLRNFFIGERDASRSRDRLEDGILLYYIYIT